MEFKFPSDEWIKELSAQLNTSETYEQSAKDWEGDFTFIVEPDDSYPETAYLYLGLYHGRSPAARQISALEEEETPFTLSAPFGTWRKVIEGTLDPIQAMMMRKIKVKGNMMKIMRYPKAAKEVVTCCAFVPTTFGD